MKLIDMEVGSTDADILRLNELLLGVCSATPELDARYLEQYLAGYPEPLIAILQGVLVEDVKEVTTFNHHELANIIEAAMPHNKRKFNAIGGITLRETYEYNGSPGGLHDG